MKYRLDWVAAIALVLLSSANTATAQDQQTKSNFSGLPSEPIEIGNEPQFLYDNYVVDNLWAIRYKRQAVRRVFHAPKKHASNPLMTGDQPSHLWVIRDPDNGLFRMYYQANHRLKIPANAKGRKFSTHIAYAESKDGVHWTKPHLNRFKWHKKEPNNIVIGRIDNPDFETSAPCILDVPEKDRRGFRYLMVYRAKGKGGRELNGIRLIGSQDGVNWDPKSDTRIAQISSDCHNTISYDARQKQYVMYCRAKHIYRAWGDQMLDTGASRRVARLSSKTLWGDWIADAKPQTVLVPDEIDNERHFNFFYGMPTRIRHGIYWGFLQPFRMNDYLYTELALSRDGFHFHRFPKRQKLIEFGPDGAWDDTMILASPFIEVGDEWRVYYNGWDGPHGTSERTSGIGLATIRKEGFVSIRGPQGGGVVCTRTIRWPGGDLLINADASQEN